MNTFKPIGPIAAGIVADLAVRRDALAVRALPERVFLEFVAEIIASPGETRERLARYAAIDGEALTVTGGDVVPPVPLHEVPT